MLSPLRQYIAAMGGELRLVVEFTNRPPIRLIGISDFDEPGKPSHQSLQLYPDDSLDVAACNTNQSDSHSPKAAKTRYLNQTIIFRLLCFTSYPTSCPNPASFRITLVGRGAYAVILTRHSTCCQQSPEFQLLAGYMQHHSKLAMSPRLKLVLPSQSMTCNPHISSGRE